MTSGSASGLGCALEAIGVRAHPADLDDETARVEAAAARAARHLDVLTRREVTKPFAVKPARDGVRRGACGRMWSCAGEDAGCGM